MNTHKHSPQAIARAVIERQLTWSVSDDMRDEIERLIVAGITGYNDASNQRPENLSEVCARLGVNLHWIDPQRLRDRVTGLLPGQKVRATRYLVYVGLRVPFSAWSTEEDVISQLEELWRDNLGDVQIWVEAAS